MRKHPIMRQMAGLLLAIAIGGAFWSSALHAQMNRGRLTIKGVWPGLVRGPVSKVAVAGDLLAVAVREFDNSEVVFFDTSDPNHPSRVGRYATVSDALDIFLTPNHAYLADDRWTGSNNLRGLTIVDVTDPAHPFRRGRYDVSDARDFLDKVYVSGDCASVLVWNSENSPPGALEILDVSDPSSPKRTGRHGLLGFPSSVQIAGNYAYVAESERGGFAGLEIFDISEKTQPVRTGGYSFDLPFRCVADVYVSGNYAYLATCGGIEIIDVSNPGMPSRVGQLWNLDAFGIKVSGNYAYIGGNFWIGDWVGRGLGIFDVSDPSNPLPASFIRTPGYARDVDVAQGYAYVADGPAGLQVADVMDPLEPLLLTTMEDEPVNYVHVAEEHAYVAAENKLVILDVSDPGAPRTVHDTTNYSRVLRVVENNALVPATIWTGSNYAPALDIIDVSTPAEPVPLSRHPTRFNFSAVQVAGGLVYLTEHATIGSNQFWGLELLDIRDPVHPLRVGDFLIGGVAHDVRVSGHYAYVADGTNDLRVLDISDLANPVTVAIYNTNLYFESGSRSLDLIGNYIYAGGPEGFHVLDIRNPSSPLAVLDILDGFSFFHVAEIESFGKYACICLPRPNGSAPSALLLVLDVSNPARPVTIAGYDLPQYNCTLQVVDSCVYIATRDAGLLILEIIQAPSISSISRHGNTLRMSWKGAPGLKLQQSTSLSDPVWNDVPGSEGQSRIELPIGVGHAFFRLEQP